MDAGWPPVGLEVRVGVDDLAGVGAAAQGRERRCQEEGASTHSSTLSPTTVTPSPPSWLSPGRYIRTYGESSRYSRTACFSAPVPCPCRTRTPGSPFRKAWSRKD